MNENKLEKGIVKEIEDIEYVPREKLNKMIKEGIEI